MLTTGKRLPVKEGQKNWTCNMIKSQTRKCLSYTLMKNCPLMDTLLFSICNKLAKRFGTLKRIKGCLLMHQRLFYYNSVIKPVMMYSSDVWTNFRKDYRDMVFKLQERATRVILDAPHISSTIQLFNRLKWLPFYEESKIKKSAFVFLSKV